MRSYTRWKTGQVINYIFAFFQFDSRWNCAIFHMTSTPFPTPGMRCEIFSPWFDYRGFFFPAPQSVKHSNVLRYATRVFCRPPAAVSPGDGFDDADWHHALWDLLPGQRLGHRQGQWCVSLQSGYGHPQPAPQARVLLLCLPNVPRARRRLQPQLWWVKQSHFFIIIFFSARKSQIMSMWKEMIWIIEKWKVLKGAQSFLQTFGSSE